MEQFPTADDCKYASQVLKDEATFCVEQADNEGAAMLTRVISILDEIQEPLTQFKQAMDKGQSPMTFLLQWAISQNSDIPST